MCGVELGEAMVAGARRLVTRLEGMTDAEYLWEPVPGCWSVRPAADGSWRADLGPTGTTWTDATPPPLTTIAWRMWHLGASPSPAWPPDRALSPRAFAAAWFGQPRPDGAPGIGTAGEAIDAFERHWTAVGHTVATYAEAELRQPIGAVGGPFREGSILGLVLHVADELTHHAAEVALLRDLYRAGYRG